jgi:hypothetical protein
MGPAPRRSADAIARESQGNPLFLSELARSAGDHDPGRGRRPTLAHLVRDRILALTPSARRILDVVAIAGAPLDTAIAAEAALLRTGVPQAVSELCRARLLRASRAAQARRLECFHDRIREVAVAELSETAFRDAHLGLAEVLEQREDVDAAAVAMHLRAAGEPARAFRFAVAAAEEATATLAFDRAAALYRFALGLCEHPPERRRRLECDLGDALANAGRGPEAADAYLAAVEGADDVEVFELRCGAAGQLLRAGHLERGRALLAEVLASVGLKMPATNRAAILATVVEDTRLRVRGLRTEPRAEAAIDPRVRAQIETGLAVAIGVLSLGVSQCWHLVPRTARLALDAGDLRSAGRALAIHSWIMYALGLQRARSRRLLDAAQGLAETTGDAYMAALIRLARAYRTMYVGEWAETIQHADASIEQFGELRIGASSEVQIAEMARESALSWSGEIQEASRRLQEQARSARERGDLHAEVVRRSNRLLSVVWLAADDPDLAAREVAAARAKWVASPSPVMDHLSLQAELSVLLYVDPIGAWERSRATWQARNPIAQRVQFTRVWSWSIRGKCAVAAAARLEDPRPALRDAELARRKLLRERLPWTDAIAASLQAGIAMRKSGEAAALPELQRAADLLDRAHMKLWAAIARWHAGRILGGEEGEMVREEAQRAMARQRIVDPVRFSRLFVPGFE